MSGRPLKLAARVVSPLLFPAAPKIPDALRRTAPDAATNRDTRAVGDNAFVSTFEGPNPPESAGDAGDQTLQLLLTGSYQAYSLFGALPLIGVRPSEYQRTLSVLRRSPLIEGSPVSRATYESHIPGATPDDTFEHLVTNTGRLFAAGGLALLPAPSCRLATGDRFFVADKWSTPWVPVEANVDEAERAVKFLTLDGHPFLGYNGFQAIDAGERGGTLLVQTSEFQSSSEAAEKGFALIKAHERQNEAWHALHNQAFRDLAK